MKTIRFTDETRRKDGLQVITLNGLVEFTGIKGEYRIPNYVVELLDKKRIPYELVNRSTATSPKVEIVSGA